jgi:hypothetical protein
VELPESYKQIKVSKFQAPTSSSESKIPFELMDPIMFELLCCDLIEHLLNQDLGKEIFDVQPISGGGRAQFGADIFVEENINSNRFISLYEVKRVKKYNLDSYLKTVQRFLDNYDKWGLKIDNFFLLTANDMSATEIAEWKKQATQLSDIGIVYEIVPKQLLNKWIKGAPNIVYKYFHKAWVEMFWGPRGLQHIENYGVYNFKESASWSNYKGIVHQCYGNSFSYQNEHVSIKGFLPTISENTLSCFVEFRNGKFSHVMTTLGSQQLIERYFPELDIPLDEIDSYHPFLIKNSNSDEKRFFCDIGNSRLELSYIEVECLIFAMQAFKSEYIKCVRKIENEWRSSEFFCDSNTGEDIPLIQIKRGLWRILLEFANSHDSFNSESEWAMFDSCPGMLKIFTQVRNESMNAGYHSFIKPKRVDYTFSNYSHLDDEVILAWMPPRDNVFSNDGAIGPRFYWDVKTAHDWLVYELIPEALAWAECKEKVKGFKWKNVLNIFKRRKKQDIPYNPERYLSSFFRESVSKNISEIKTSSELLNLVNKLQHFFNCSKSIHVDLKSYRALYLNLATVMKHTKLNKSHFGYIYSNLNYLDATDFISLINALEAHADNSKSGCSNSFRVDCVLRSYQSCLEKGISNLNNVESNAIAEELKPLVQIMEEKELLVRQSRYF